MDILLWRHAEAEDGPDDMTRGLTLKGREQATLIAEWVRRYGPRKLMVWSSGALRAKQTAEALGMPYMIDTVLEPSTNFAPLLAWVSQYRSQAKSAMMVVGHQPNLGLLVSRLTLHSNQELHVPKAGMYWLFAGHNSEYDPVKIRAMVGPSVLARSKR